MCCTAAGNGIGDAGLEALNVFLERNKAAAKEAAAKAVAEKAAAAEKTAAAKKAAAEKAAAEKAAAEKAAAEQVEREARMLDLEKQLAAALAAAKAMAEAPWWPWRQEAAPETPKAPEKAPPSERLTSERARASHRNAPDPKAAELFWKTRYRFSVPHEITEQMTNHVKGIVRSRLPPGVPFEDVYPKVVISYASGRRPQDCEGAGPGMFYAADFLEFLHERRVPAFSGLHVPAGKDWRCFMLRLEGKKAQAKVLVVLLTAALYQSKPCLEEINAAVENHIPLLPSASLALPIPDPSGPCALPCALLLLTTDRHLSPQYDLKQSYPTRRISGRSLRTKLRRS